VQIVAELIAHDCLEISKGTIKHDPPVTGDRGAIRFPLKLMNTTKCFPAIPERPQAKCQKTSANPAIASIG